MKKICSLVLTFLCLLSIWQVPSAQTNIALYHELLSNFEGSDGSFFYTFQDSINLNRFSLQRFSGESSFLQTETGNGYFAMRQYANGGLISHGIINNSMYADTQFRFEGKIRYQNYSRLISKPCFLACYLTKLTGFPLYNDAACTDYYGEAEGGFVQVNALVDSVGKSFYDDRWHEFSMEFFPVMKHSTGKYVDMRGRKVDLWIRPFGGSADIKPTTDYFKPGFITECEQNGILPYVEVNLDDLKGSYVRTASTEVGTTQITVDKDSVKIGDAVNVRYDLNSTGTDTSFITLLQDGFPIRTLNGNGATSFLITEDMVASNLTITLTPSVDYSDGKMVQIADLGTVGGGFCKLYAETTDGKSLSFRLEGVGETEKSEVFTAFYDKNRKLLRVTSTQVPTANGKKRILAENTYFCENASYATVYYWENTKNISPKLQCKIVHLYTEEERVAFYVDGENGNDRNRGTEENPVKTLETAKTLVQSYLADMQSDVYVYVKGGTYTLKEPLEFGVKDSGRNGNSVIYLPWGDETPVISGGESYKGFELYDASQNIWRTYVGVGTVARQVYINGVRGVRARNDAVRTNYINDNGTDGPGILTNAVMDAENYTYTCDDIEYASFKNQSDMEAVYYEYWTNPRVKVQKIEVNDEGKCVFYMQPASMKNGLSSTNCPITLPMWFENAYELLNTEGEWYLDKADGYLYYKPRPEENPETMTATIPKLERAITIAGESADEMVQNISFRGFRFEMFTWLYPSLGYNSYRDSQANNLTGYPGDGILTGQVEDAAVIVANADNVDFVDCVFTKLGGAGINYRQTFRNCDLTGNHIYDLSGTGINMGVAGAESGNVAMYRNPTEEKYFRTNNHITNNYIHDVGIDYRSCVGISLSWVRNSSIAYNEIYNVNYSGMHIGWGWASYAETGTGMINVDIHHNYIHDTAREYLCDTGGIYTLGATGGNAENYNKIRDNYLENMRGTPAAIYPDEGSTFWEITRNVVDTGECPVITNKRYRKGHELEWLVIHTNSIINNYIHDNYATTDACRKFNTQTNIYEPVQHYPDGNFPDQAQNIIETAGLQPSYLAKIGGVLQRLKVDKSDIRMFVGEQDSISVVPMGRKLTELSDYDIRFYSTNENVAIVDQNGNITAVDKGKCNVRACILSGDVFVSANVDVTVE